MRVLESKSGLQQRVACALDQRLQLVNSMHRLATKDVCLRTLLIMRHAPHCQTIFSGVTGLKQPLEQTQVLTRMQDIAGEL